jgi:hypothetical protein
MFNYIAKGICLAKHADGRETLTKDQYLFLNFREKKGYAAAAQSRLTCADYFTFTQDNQKITYDFTVKNSVGDYTGKTEVYLSDTTVWGEKILVSNYETSRGSTGKILYDRFHPFTNDTTGLFGENDNLFDTLADLFDQIDRHGTFLHSKKKLPFVTCLKNPANWDPYSPSQQRPPAYMRSPIPLGSYAWAAGMQECVTEPKD